MNTTQPLSATNNLRWNRTEGVDKPWRPSTWQSVTLHFTQLLPPGLPANPIRLKPGWPAATKGLDLTEIHCELGWPAPCPARGRTSGGKHGHQYPVRVFWSNSLWQNCRRSPSNSRPAAWGARSRSSNASLTSTTPNSLAGPTTNCLPPRSRQTPSSASSCPMNGMKGLGCPARLMSEWWRLVGPPSPVPSYAPCTSLVPAQSQTSGRWPGIWPCVALAQRQPSMECTSTRVAGSLTPSLPCSLVKLESCQPLPREATAPMKQRSSGIGRL
eukprot:1148965-Amphidinium_carterae.1